MSCNGQADIALHLFGNKAAQYYNGIHDVANGCDGFNYQFMEMDSYKRLYENHQLAEAQRVYWSEIIYRAHITACASLLRAERWLNGVLDGYRIGNLFVWAASLRGLIESTVDSFIPLAAADSVFRKNLEQINKILKTEFSKTAYWSHDLENELIHFMHGRKLSGEESKQNPQHKTKRTQEYLLSMFPDKDHAVHDSYRKLCEIVHPACSSVAAFVNENGCLYTLSNCRDREYLNNINKSVQLQYVYECLLLACFGFPVSILRCINRMELPDLFIRTVEKYDHIDGTDYFRNLYVTMLAGDIIGKRVKEGEGAPQKTA
ncbi:MAG TPA: hypothetical protein VG733_01085 [Chthoniobacteraceae bacterium]|nr:hypothetical protein [Chthoniobacteraceae bacterium]